MKVCEVILLLVLLCGSVFSVQAERLNHERLDDFVHHQHDSIVNEIWLSADRPGAGTGSEVLRLGTVQWETGFEVAHIPGAHLLTLPATLFRFGLPKRAELRLEYSGVEYVPDKPGNPSDGVNDPFYTPSHLSVGTKINLFENHGKQHTLRWVPRTSLLLCLGLPTTPALAKNMPVAGSVDLLFENEVTDWLSLGYDVGIQWNEWAPTPDVFTSVGFNFEATDRLGCFVEAFAFFDPDAIDTSMRTVTHCDVNLNFGLTYAVHPRVQLDIYAGFNCYNSEPLVSAPQNNAFVGFGAAWLIWHPENRH